MSKTVSASWKKILCPIDFSERSVSALGYAVVLGQRDGAALFLVHVVRPIDPSSVPVTPMSTPMMVSGTDLAKMQEGIRDTEIQRLRHLAREVVPESLPCRTEVRMGRPADELADYAEQEQIDLIVMASRGHGRWARFLFGSVAERLLKLADCPTLILPIE